MIRYAYVTNNGLVNPNNEDTIVLNKTVKSNGNFKKKGFYFGSTGSFAVLDGVGGSDNGNLASATCGNFFSKYFKYDVIKDRSTLYNAIYLMNNKLVEDRAKSNSEGMKTTIVSAIINKEEIIFFNIGDSAGYLFKDNKLTKEFVEDTYRSMLIKERKLSLEEIDKIDTAHVITNCLGINDFDKMKTHSFIVKKEKKKQLIILMSDGISDLISSDELNLMLIDYKFKNIKEIMNNIEKLVLERGAHDNYSLIFVEV